MNALCNIFVAEWNLCIAAFKYKKIDVIIERLSVLGAGFHPVSLEAC